MVLYCHSRTQPQTLLNLNSSSDWHGSWLDHQISNHQHHPQQLPDIVGMQYCFDPSRWNMENIINVYKLKTTSIDLLKWKTISLFLWMEDDLQDERPPYFCLLNGRLAHFFVKWTISMLICKENVNAICPNATNLDNAQP